MKPLLLALALATATATGVAVPAAAQTQVIYGDPVGDWVITFSDSTREYWTLTADGRTLGRGYANKQVLEQGTWTLTGNKLQIESDLIQGNGHSSMTLAMDGDLFGGTYTTGTGSFAVLGQKR